MAVCRRNRARAVLVMRHGELRGRALVQPAAGAVTRVVHGASHIVSGLQVALQKTQAARVGVFARRDPQHRLEASLQMEGTLLEFFAQALKSDGLVEVLLDVAADLLYAVRLRTAAGGLWLASQAGAVASPLRLLETPEERDVLPPRTTSRTRGPAIDTPGGDAEYELPVICGGGAGDPHRPAGVPRRPRPWVVV